MQRREVFAALDIGSNKVYCAIAKINDGKIKSLNRSPNTTENNQDQIKVLGTGYHEARGLKPGAITDLDALEDSILSAIQNAEQQARQNINSIYVSLPPSFTKVHKIRTEISLGGHAVDENHLRLLLKNNYDEILRKGQQIIHVIPISYQIDAISGIKNPKGMIGEKLSSTLLVVSSDVHLINNLENCIIGRCALGIDGYIASCFASGLATLDENEMELGATVVDMGAQHTSIASFIHGNLVNIDYIPLGGASITTDIARVLGTPIRQAERLKTIYGNLIPSSSDDRENILIHQMGEKGTSNQSYINKGLLTEIIRSRSEEILEYIIDNIAKSRIDPLVYQRVILTGGCSNLQGFKEMVSHTLGRQTRVGLPSGLQGTLEIMNSPIFSTCAGVLHYAMQSQRLDQIGILTPKSWNIFAKTVGWLKKNF